MAATVNPALEPARFLQEVEQDSCLLLQRKRGIYAFAHLTFQEYLAAVHVQKQHLEADLIAHVPEKWGRKVILLYCASNDASAFIKACLRRAETSMGALELAIDCEKEALQVALEVRSRLQALLQEGAETGLFGQYLPGFHITRSFPKRAIRRKKAEQLPRLEVNLLELFM